MTSLYAVAFLCLAQPQTVKPPQAIRPPQYPPYVVVEPVKQKTYSDYYKEAMQAKKPLVAFVNMPARTISGAVTCTSPELDGFGSAPSIVIGMPTDTYMRTVIQLPANATDEQIRQAIWPKEESILHDPFRPSTQTYRFGSSTVNC